MPAKASVKFRLRVTRGDDIAVGPGKVDLLEAIAKNGSITAAAKDLGMSYRRAWMLVDTMNRCFKSPVVDAESGGRRGGGTALTPLGLEVVRHYRRSELLAEKAAAADLRALARLLRRR
jgi:molybdate transport system regulatory protein